MLGRPRTRAIGFTPRIPPRKSLPAWLGWLPGGIARLPVSGGAPRGLQARPAIACVLGHNTSPWRERRVREGEGGLTRGCLGEQSLPRRLHGDSIPPGGDPLRVF